jgi:hypothetical protein
MLLMLLCVCLCVCLYVTCFLATHRKRGAKGL